jgi:hypothetical protein
MKPMGFCGSLPCKGGASFFPLQSIRKEGCMMVVTWDALYKVATLLVDTGILVCSIIAIVIASHKNDDNDKNKK